MGIDFVVDYGCAVKDLHGTEKLVKLVKQRSQVDTVVSMFRQQGDNRPASEISFQRIVERPDGVVKQNVYVADLIKESDDLYALQEHCEGCIANIFKGPFGCYRYISYPIKAETENWLMSLLPNDINSTAGLVLRKCVADFKYDGGPFVHMRQEERFFELRQPIVRNLITPPRDQLASGNFSIDANQIMQMMFGVGPVHPPHAAMLLLFLGVVPHNSEVALLVSPGEMMKQANKTIVMGHSDEADEAQIWEMKNFLFALLLSMNLRADVIVDF